MSIVHHFGYWQLSWPRSYLKFMGKKSWRVTQFWDLVNGFLTALWPGAHRGVWAWSVNELWWPDPGTVSIAVAACSVHFQWAMHQTVSILMPSGLIRCRPRVLTTIYQLAGWEHCHMSRDTVWSPGHTPWPRPSRVQSSFHNPQASPDGPAHAQTFSIQSSFGNIKILWYKIGRWCNNSRKCSAAFKMSSLMFWWNLGYLDSMQFIAISCGSHLSFLVLRRFIGVHNCVTPHCFPQIESEEEFSTSSDQDRPAWISWYLLTDYAIITHKINITFTSLTAEPVVYCWLSWN